MEELTKQEEIEAIRQAQAEKLTPAQLKEELETEEALEELYQKAKLMVFEVGPERQGNHSFLYLRGYYLSERVHAENLQGNIHFKTYSGNTSRRP